MLRGWSRELPPSSWSAVSASSRYSSVYCRPRVTGTAVFNVAPENAGLHFNKVQCFCFTEQTLAPGQTVDMAVSFYIDPGWVDDDDTKDFSELTLSYTFYPAQKAQEKTGKTASSADSTRTGG